jgi:hypothetical protein
LPLVNNIDVVYIKLFLHAIGNHVYDIFMIGNSGQIFRFVLFCAVHVCRKLEYLSNIYGYVMSTIFGFCLIPNVRVMRVVSSGKQGIPALLAAEPEEWQNRWKNILCLTDFKLLSQLEGNSINK